MTGPPEAAYAVALAGLPGIGPRRLLALLEQGPPQDAWSRMLWSPEAAAAASAVSVPQVWATHAEAGVQVDVVGSIGYPDLLAADHEPPAVLFSRGSRVALEHRRVAVVGTRRCTRYGREVAEELGRELAAAGVSVVSGLALGIDGAAHEGALAAGAAPPVAVVGSGLDVVYPRRHAGLWRQVGEHGLLLSEAPLGARPEAWRFPVRNRIIAALAEVVVVVESHATGGSHHTVEAAVARGRTVMAVPGSVRSSASSYTNSLLADGCPPARDATDVLVALGLTSATRRAATDPRPRPSPSEEHVLEAIGWQAASLDQIVGRCGRSPLEVSVALAHLERDGWVVGGSGWWERRAAAG